jgi:hypothetical protein
MYPSVVDVSIGMKIIENHKTDTSTDITTYKYDFDGRGNDNSVSETTNTTPVNNSIPQMRGVSQMRQLGT